MAGTLFVVATPIGNLEDISARALRILREVALIAAEDTRRTGHLLQRFGIGTRTTSFHEHSDKGKTADLLEQLRAGDSIALVSDAGTPGISDPGQHLVHLAHEAGVKVEPVPGPSALATAISASGFMAESFLFLGFPPTRNADRKRWLERVASASAVANLVVFYEAPHRIERTLGDLHRTLGEVEVFLARELTKAHETLTLDRLPVTLASSRGEFTVVLNLGRTANVVPAETPSPESLRYEFGCITNNGEVTRRQAITTLSRRHRIPARAVYAALEAMKNSGG